MANEIDCFENLMKPENLAKIFGEGSKVPKEALRQIAQDLQTLKNLNPNEDFQSKFQNYVNDVQVQQMIEKGQRAADLRKARNIRKYMMQESNYGKPLQALKALLSGNTSVLSIGGRDSVFGRYSSIHNQVMSKLIHGLEDTKLTELAKSGTIDGEAKQVMEALNLGKEMPNVSQEGKVYGGILHDIYKFMLVEARNADIPVRNLPGFSGPIREDLKIMHSTPFEKWAQDVLEAGIDKEKTFGVHAGDQKAEDKILRAIYDGKKLGFGSADSVVPKIDEEVREGISYSRKLSEARQLRFTNAQAETNYLGKYGKGTVLQMVMDDVNRKSRMIALVSKLGANPEAGLMNAVDTMIDQYKKDNKPDLAAELSGGKRELQNIMHVATNKSSIPGSNNLARITDGVLFAHTLSKLWWSGVGSLPNLAVTASTLRAYNGSSFFDNMFKIGNEWLKNFKPSDQAWAARQAGFAIHDSLTSAVSQGGSMFGILPRGASWMAQNMMKLNGMDYVNSMQFHFANMLQESVADATRSTFKDLVPQMKTGFLMAGIEEKDFNLLKHAVEEMPDGRQMVTVEAIGRLTKETPGLKDRATEMGLSPSAYISDLKNKYFGSVIHGMTDSTTSSTWREQAFFRQGYDKGTWHRAVYDLVGQFKQFLVQAANISTKIANSAPDLAALEQGNLKNANGYAYGDMAKFLAGTTAMGALSLIFKGAARKGGAMAFDAGNEFLHRRMDWADPTPVVQPGNNSIDPRHFDFWVNAMNKGGAGGMYMDMLLGDNDMFPYAESILGPTFGPIAGEVLPNVARIKNALGSSGEPKSSDVTFFKNRKDQTAFWSDMGRLVKQNVPFGQLPIFEQALNYAYYNVLKDGLSPGYVYNRQAREARARARGER